MTNGTQDASERAFALMRKMKQPARKRMFRLRRADPASVGRLRHEMGEAAESGPSADEELRRLQGECEAAREELAKEKDGQLRLRAEMDNQRKRAAKEKQTIRATAIEDLLRELVPVIDNFDLALSFGSDADEKSLRGVVDGVRMIAKQLFDTLASRGVKKVNELGVPFDPQFHEAVDIVPAAEGQENDTVVDILMSGYQLGDRVVRPAKVRISRKL